MKEPTNQSDQKSSVNGQDNKTTQDKIVKHSIQTFVVVIQDNLLVLNKF